MIRVAQKEDIPTVVALAELMHPEGDYSDVPFDKYYYAAFLDMTLEEDTNCLFLYEASGLVVGALLGMLTTFMFNSDKRQACDGGFFVMRDHRGSLAAPRLEQAYAAWAIQKGACRIRLSCTTANKKAGVFYERMGYTFVGGNYIKKVKGQ